MATHQEPAPSAATHDPAEAVAPRPKLPAARTSDRLAETLIEPALAIGEVARHDGWTPDRIRNFLNALAECGVVSDACRAAGMSKMSAYRLRNSAKGRAFLLAWRAALVRARRRLADDLMSRAVNGCVDLIYRDDQLVAERHRFDNRLTMDVFARLDRLLAQEEVGGAVGIVAEEFEPFVEIVSKGGQGASEFIRSRSGLGPRNSEESELIARAENYGRYGVGLPEEIDTSDLDDADSGKWTDEQAERAARARIPEPLERNGGERRQVLLWNFQNDIPGREKPLWLPAGTSTAQVLAYVRAGALGRNIGNLCEATTSAAASPPARVVDEADDAQSDELQPETTRESGCESPLRPAVRASCAPEDYDPESGLLPPHGWVASGA